MLRVNGRARILTDAPFLDDMADRGLGLSSVTEGLLLLFPEETDGLYQWSQGSISQNGFDGIVQMTPVALVGLAGLLLTARRVDALALGDEAAQGLGVPVRSTRITVWSAPPTSSAGS